MWPVPESVRRVLAGERDAEVQQVLRDELAKTGTPIQGGENGDN